MAANKKYRPVLTAAMIEHILALAKRESPISSESITLIGTLAPFQAKIANDGIAEAYTMAPAKESIEESLGMENLMQPIAGEYFLKGEYFPNKEAYWEACYTWFKSNPAALSLQEIQSAREHMYLNDLMTQEELIDFELQSEACN